MKWPLLEWKQTPVAGARAFGINHHVKSLAQHPDRGLNAFDCSLMIAAVDGNKLASFMPVPNTGTRNTSFFTSTEQRPGILGIKTGGSRLETWFDMKM